MPPRPAPTSARPGSSQRQESDVERTTTILERLAAAAELGAFCGAAAGGAPPAVHALWSSAESTAAASPGSPGRALLAAWMAAVARGMQLAAQQLDDRTWLWEHRVAVQLLGTLMAPLGCCFHIPGRLGAAAAGSGDDGDRMRVLLSVLAMRAGVVKVHEQLSLRLTTIISHPQAASSAAAAGQQQQQQMEPGVAKLVANHLQLLTFMAQAWPGGAAGIFSPSLCQAVPAAAGLAAAALRSREAIAHVEHVTITTWQTALNTVGLLCSAYARAGSSVPAQVAGSSGVATLLLMSLGLAAEQLHQLQRGLSPAAVGAAPSAAAAAAGTTSQQQQLAVPAHHTQLLQALGVAAGGAGVTKSQDEGFWRQLPRSLLQPDTQQHLADAAAAASCQQPLLLVLLECSLLDPLLAEDVSSTMQHPLAHAGEAVRQLGPALLRAILEQEACRRALEAAAPAAAAPAAAAPATTAAVPAAAAPAAAAAAADVYAGAASNLSVLQVLALLAVDINTAVVVSAVRTAGGDAAACHRLLADLAAVWLEHTAQCASLLEAGLRMMGGKHALRSASCAAFVIEVAARARLSAGSGAMAAESQQQVFALLLGCLKAATVAADKASRSGSDGAVPSANTEHIRLNVDVVEGVAAACSWLLAPSPSSTSSTSSSSSSSSSPSSSDETAPAADDCGISAQLGGVLLARCLVAAGRILQQQAQAPGMDGRGRRHIMLLESCTLQGCCSGVAVLIKQLPQQAAAEEPWVQQLLEEHAQLEQQLDSLKSQTEAASGNAGNSASELLPPPAALAALAEQLRAFGAGVCAALPLQQCCNHPDCRNLQQTSELELVGGKTCVCGGCRVARYCSRECQVAHYKGWHKAVCKRLQAQRQQRQAATQQQQQASQEQPAGDPGTARDECHSAE